MARLGLLTVLLAIQSLLNTDNIDEAKKLVAEVISEAKTKDKEQ